MKDTSCREDQYLRSATGWQVRPKKGDPKLGGQIMSYLEQHSGMLAKNAAIVDAWERVVPAGLKPFCRLDKRSGNVLLVQAMPGPYMHQVQMMAAELLEAIKRAAPRCGITKIKVVPMNKESIRL
jgi:hypothetical protein